jgi:hypothetical protein
MTFEDVIEEEKLASGASHIHVSLGPNATPEALQKMFRDQRAIAHVYNGFSDLEQLRAYVNRLEKVLDKVMDLVKTDIKEEQQPAVTNLKYKIFSLIDLIPDVDYEEDIEWMTKNRAL